MIQFLQRQWFLVLLGLALAIGFGWSEQLADVATRAPRSWIVAAVLFVMALPLELSSLLRTLTRPVPALLACGVNVVIVPLLGYSGAFLLPADLGAGLIIMAAIPCTLASAAVWTRRAGGNDSLAILVTVVTNLACFLVIPFWLQTLLGASAEIPFRGVVLRLLLLVVVPISLAQIFRLHRPLAHWATRNKPRLGVVAQMGILSMVAIGSVKAGNRLVAAENELALSILDWGGMLAVVVAVHLAALGLGHLLALLARTDRADRIAIGFAGSQKTLMVGLDLGLQYFGGLTILPMVAYHVCQLLADTLIADRLRKQK
ncbi:MAG: bile acid:sodium symporter [Planctomycetales bacterium]|nr:bile acid:sodium symporter [Planctomycetales bacterium]